MKELSREQIIKRSIVNKKRRVLLNKTLRLKKKALEVKKQINEKRGKRAQTTLKDMLRSWRLIFFNLAINNLRYQSLSLKNLKVKDGHFLSILEKKILRKISYRYNLRILMNFFALLIAIKLVKRFEIGNSLVQKDDGFEGLFGKKKRKKNNNKLEFKHKFEGCQRISVRSAALKHINNTIYGIFLYGGRSSYSIPFNSFKNYKCVWGGIKLKRYRKSLKKKIRYVLNELYHMKREQMMDAVRHQDLQGKIDDMTLLIKGLSKMQLSLSEKLDFLWERQSELNLILKTLTEDVEWSSIDTSYEMAEMSDFFMYKKLHCLDWKTVGLKIYQRNFESILMKGQAIWIYLVEKLLPLMSGKFFQGRFFNILEVFEERYLESVSRKFLTLGYYNLRKRLRQEKLYIRLNNIVDFKRYSFLAGRLKYLKTTETFFRKINKYLNFQSKRVEKFAARIRTDVYLETLRRNLGEWMEMAKMRECFRGEAWEIYLSRNKIMNRTFSIRGFKKKKGYKLRFGVKILKEHNKLNFWEYIHNKKKYYALYLKLKNKLYGSKNSTMSYVNISCSYNKFLDLRSYKQLNTGSDCLSLGYFMSYNKSFKLLSRKKDIIIYQLKQCLIQTGYYHRSEKIVLKILRGLKLNIYNARKNFDSITILEGAVRAIEPGLINIMRVKRGRSNVTVPVLKSRGYSLSKGIRWLILEVRLKRRKELKWFKDELFLEIIKVLERKSIVLKKKIELFNLIVDSRANLNVLKRTLKASKRTHFGQC